ncbi:barstar family protein [Streptomyces sp. NPDC002787]
MAWIRCAGERDERDRAVDTAVEAGRHTLPVGVRVRGDRCRTTLDVFAEWSEALGFSGYFGHNWDTFEDAMFAVARSTPLTIVLHDAARLLTDEPPRQPSTLLDILTGVSGRPADPHPPPLSNGLVT